MSPYTCRIMSGTGTAALGLGPMLDAWAREKGTVLEPGTFNLCANRFVMIAHGQRHETLEPFGHLAPAHQQRKDGFSPRLYPVVLDGTIGAWLYRWSEPGALRNFVGPQDECRHPDRFCETVAEVRLRDALSVEDGDTVKLVFGSEVQG